MNRKNANAVVKRWAAGWAAALAFLAGNVQADTTINTGSTLTIDNNNTTVSGTTRTWNDTGTLTMFNGATLQTWPSQINTVANNDALVFTGGSGTITLRFNDNDTDFMMNGAISSTATGPQTLAVLTGYNGNGDRESVTFNSGIPDGSGLSVTVTFRTQTAANSYVNLKGANTFTGPLTLVKGASVANGYLTIGGTLTRNNGNTIGTGTLNGGNYAGAISLNTATILNYASTAPQTLAGVISGAGALQVSGSGALTLSGANTYTGNTTVNSGCSLVLGSSGALKFLVTDSASNKLTGGGTATLNGSFTIDTSAVTGVSNTWTLVDVTTRIFGANFSVAGFSGPVNNVYTKVVGGQTWTFNKTSGQLNLRSGAIITSFGISGSAGVINQNTKTIALTVPYGTSLATLAPTFTLTSGTCTPPSGTPPSPSFADANPAVYTVTDGAVVNQYTVTVAVTPASTNKEMLTFTLPGVSAGTITGTNIILTVPTGMAVTNLAPTYTVSPLATASPASGTARDFTTPQLYTVTAQDGSSKSYLATVQTYEAWQYSGSLYLLTTPEGANLPAAAYETNFPVLVRLNSSFFDFSQAKGQGEDIRFSSSAGVRLPYQIEQWDPAHGTASIWVLVPAIAGNSRQEIKMYWGKADALSESSGPAVFSAANGYLSVFHLGDAVVDEVGSLTPTDTGTTVGAGVIGKSRHFPGGKGINCGESITNFPTGSARCTTEAWFRAGAVNGEIVDWGTEGGGNKVQVRLVSPPRIYVDGNGASLYGNSAVALGQWYHVAHTFNGSGTAQICLNGQLDSTAAVTMSFANPAKMWIGGWYNNYNYVGDIDEVRVSKVVRSTNWFKLEYQNQNPVQTLVGPLVQPGTNFSVSPASVTMDEGATASLVGQAGGAQKLYWVCKQNGQETVLAVDQFTLNFTPGRISGDQSLVLQFKAVYPTGVKTNDIPVTVRDTVPEPAFTLNAPASWDGRQTLTVTPSISNWSALQAAGVTNLNYTWSVGGVAVLKQITPGVLTLLRSQGSGPMTVTLALDNGGPVISNTASITVQEPAADAWVQRSPDPNEKPVNGQFYARDDTGFGTIFYNGTVSGSPNSVFLNVYANGVLYTNLSQVPAGGAYAFSARIAAGLVKYSVQFGTVTGTTTNVLNTVSDLECGDAYILDGQSNAVADNYYSSGSAYVYYTNQWIRSYGQMGGGTNGGWGTAVSTSTAQGSSTYMLGLWGMMLASNLVANYQVPICMINGAVGGTRIDQHQANPANHFAADSYGNTLYANLLARVAAAKLTHGIRGALWHQGENNSGAAAPTGDYDYKSYQQYFMDMSAAWKQDFPNLRYYYVYQVWPLPCSMGPTGDQLREAQRTLPRLYSHLSVMSTIGIVSAVTGRGLCHFDVDGYLQMANLMAPLVKQDNYGLVPAQPITAPNLQRAYYTSASQNEVALEFNQPMAWNSAATVNFFLDRVGSLVNYGTVSGNTVKLQLRSPSAAKTIDYLEDSIWSGSSANLLRGGNGIAALTFSTVAIEPWAAAQLPVIDGLLPASGRTNGGTVVTITGSNFLSGASVQFDGVNATSVTVDSATQLRAVSPAHGPGLVNVTVGNTNGMSTLKVNGFEYVLPPAPMTLNRSGQQGTNLVLVWAGETGTAPVLLSATNIAQPGSTWTPLATNLVGAGGLSTNTIPMLPGEPQRFYRQSVPYN